jgi:hypothetical protein
MSGWWKAIEEHVAEREENAPDPWGDRPLADAGLTDEQEEFLSGLDDQPRPGRLTDDGAPAAGERAGTATANDVSSDAGETGNSPGDEEEPPGVASPA